jgi:hypothetical protein
MDPGEYSNRMTQQLEYRDFEIEIAPGDGDGYRVAVLRSPSGQAREVMHFPFDRTTLNQRLMDLENALRGESGEDAKRLAELFGAQLFDALMGADVRGIYDMSRQATTSAGRGLRIKLRVNAPELATVPWEFLFDRRQEEFVTLSRYVPIVRYVELPLPDTELVVAAPLRILGLVASPTDAAPLDVEREKTRLEEAVGELRASGMIELVWLEGQTWRELQAAMQGGPWHIFHFVGHGMAGDGATEGLLLLADEYGDAVPLGATELGRLLADHHTLRLALLNACEGAQGQQGDVFSSIASALVRRGLPAVLAMQYQISDGAALEFTTSFYRALVANLPIDAATSEARKAISLAAPESMEWGIPALFMRAPDGMLWNVKKDGGEMSSDQDRNWWDGLPDSIGDVGAGEIGGDVIIATVGTGAQNVVVGKNNVQTISEVLGEPTAGDKQIIEQELAHVKARLKDAEGEIGAGAAKLAGGMLSQIANEMLKTGADERPNAAIITQMGDVLLDSVPQLGQALGNLFAAPAAGRVLAKAGEPAVAWVKERFGTGGPV